MQFGLNVLHLEEEEEEPFSAYESPCITIWNNKLIAILFDKYTHL